MFTGLDCWQSVFLLNHHEEGIVRREVSDEKGLGRDMRGVLASTPSRLHRPSAFVFTETLFWPKEKWYFPGQKPAASSLLRYLPSLGWRRNVNEIWRNTVFVVHVFQVNRPFPSSLVPLFQNESKCETFYMKMSSACSFIFMQIKVIFIRMFSHLDQTLFETDTQRNSESGLLSSRTWLVVN